jgi:D-citramalate synthase
LAFLNKQSIDWVYEANGKTVNLLAKGSKLHLLKQLRIDEKSHKELIEEIYNYAKDKGMRVNIYLEDVSYGIQEDKNYVYNLLDFLETLEFNRVMLPDTRGILSPALVRDLFAPVIKEYKKLIFDFHGHNDYGLAVANSIEAANIGFNGIHGTINGMGERAGNTPIEELITAIKDFTKRRINANEKYIYTASLIVQKFSGKKVVWNKPIVGENVFTHTAGIHADGEKKGELYTSKLNPERFGREKQFSLGKLSGKASIELALEKIGIKLDDEALALLKDKILKMAENKMNITESDIISLIENIEGIKVKPAFNLISLNISDENDKYVCSIKFFINNNGNNANDLKPAEVKASGKSYFMSLYECINKICIQNGLEAIFLQSISIKDEITKTNVELEWKDKKGKTFKTYGYEEHYVKALMSAIEKALNYGIIRKMQ